MPCKPELLEGVSLFEHLGEEDRVRLAEVVDMRTLAEGETLFKAGEPGDSLFVVRDGGMELYIRDTVGQKIVLSHLEPGEIFGELALLDGGARTATAVASVETHLLELDRDDLLLLFQQAPTSALRLLSVMGHMTRKADELLKKRVSRNVNEEIAEDLGGLERIADLITQFSGSMPFLLLNAVWFASWIAINTLPLGLPVFDPYPFGLLTMIVSLEAIFLSCFVLVSQKRQTEKDRVRADIEYEINVKAELEVAHLHEKTDQIHEDMLQRFARLEKLMGPKE
jgi:uncharacterized membrane protein